jgi:TPR repeat protein
LRLNSSPVLLESGASAARVLARYDAVRQTLAPPSDSELWAALQRAHSLGCRGAGLRIAVIDGECDLSYEALKRRVVKRKSWTPIPTTPPDLAHGTAVGLLIAAIAPDCQIEWHNVVREDGSLDEYAVCDAIDDAAAAQVDIINLSLGRETILSEEQLRHFAIAYLNAHPLTDEREYLEADHNPDCRLCAAAERAAARGVRVVCAAGNNKNTVFCPARAKGARAVAYMAVAPSVFPVGSELAERLSLEATAQPQAALYDNTVMETDGFPGTSFAAPIVAGEAALCQTALDFTAYQRAALLDGRAHAVGNFWTEKSASAEEFEMRRRGAQSLYVEAFRQLPHVHCQFQRDLRNDLPWTDPATCPTCGIFARSAFINGGLFFLEAENLDNALSILWAAHRLMPWNARAAANLAKTLQLQGDPQQAVEIYDHALRLRQGFEVYQTTRDQIEADLSRRKPPTPPETITLSAADEQRALRLARSAAPYFQEVMRASAYGGKRPAVDQKAIRAVEEASRLGYAGADYPLAISRLMDAKPGSAEETSGLFLLRRAAFAGFAPAQMDIGRLYAKGWHGVPKDWRWAVEWFEKAAAQGLNEARAALATACEKGLGAPQSYARAFDWLRQAADHDADSMQRLGWYFAVGVGGTPRDGKRAVACFENAAAAGHALAKCCLGLAHERGEGVRKNIGRARSWYEKAAAQGDAQAQKALERLRVAR